MRCCVEGACEEVDWGWDAELVGEEEQAVALAGYTFFRFGSRFMSFMIFTTFYDRFLTGADEELNKYARVLGFCSYVSLIQLLCIRSPESLSMTELLKDSINGNYKLQCLLHFS